MCETWKNVEGYEGYYSVSDRGRVRRDCGGGGTGAGYILKSSKSYPQGHRDGYVCMRVNLCVDGKVKQFKVHQLVARAFLGPNPDGLDIHHKDGNPENNRVENLEYLSHGDHIRKTVEERGFANCASLTADQVRYLRASWMPRPSATLSELAEEYGVNRQTILNVANGKNSRCLSPEAQDEIRARYPAGRRVHRKSANALAKELGVSKKVVLGVVNGRTYKHIR